MPTDKNILQLTETTNPDSGSVLYTVIDPSGTPLDRKVTMSNLITALNNLIDHGVLAGLSDDDHPQYRKKITTVNRLTGNTSLDNTYHIIMGDTDGGAFEITLPAGVAGTNYRITNTGSNGNDITVTPDGTEKLFGNNASFTLIDSETINIYYEATEGWW